MIFLEAVCQSETCGRKYLIATPHRPKAAVDLAISQAACPHCGEPREPAMCKGIRKKDRCRECGIPCTGSQKAARGLCWPHYRDELAMEKRVAALSETTS